METPLTPGWYDDPESPEQLRYFDGVVWTRHTAPRRTRAAAPQAAAGVPPQAPQAPQPGYPAYGQGGAPQQQAPRQGWLSDYQRQGGWNAPAPTAGQRPRTPDGVPLASYWQRVGAYLIDTIITGVVTALLGGWFIWPYVQRVMDEAMAAARSGSTSLLPSEGLQPDLLTQVLPFTIVSLAVGLGYQAFFLMRTGATPGKAALGISVRLRERPGTLDFPTVFRRYLLEIVFAAMGFVPGLVSVLGTVGNVVDLLWPAWDDKRQALHDKVAATNVVVGKQPHR